MKNILNTLPSMWETLKNDNKKIVLYGMGDGAVKLLRILEKEGLSCAGIFASDDFVRHQSFMGFTVKSLAELEEEYHDFTVLTAFATRLPEVMENFKRISERHTLFVPDINVSGDYLELFDRAFFEENIERLEGVCNALDGYGKEFFKTLISYKYTGRLEYLEALEVLRESAPFPYDREKITSFADFGAYTGDTVKEAIALYPRLEKISAFEPDAKSFAKLLRNTEGESVDIRAVNALVWNENTKLVLRSGGAMNTIIEKNVTDSGDMQKKKIIEVDAVKGDDAIPFAPDLIKMDVEGCEREAIEGCRRIISEGAPVLRVSIYHNHRDLFDLYEKISALHGGYEYTLRQKCRYIPAWDVELIALKDTDK